MRICAASNIGKLFAKKWRKKMQHMYAKAQIMTRR